MAKRPKTSARGGPTDTPAPGLSYASSGVDLENYDKFIAALGSITRRTHGPRVLPNEGGFAGLFRLDFNEKLFKRNFKDPVLVACCDGVGTKVKLAAQTGVFDTLGLDLVAMSINDLIVQGAEPLFFLDYIAVPKVDRAMLLDLVKGVARGCEISGCALLGGETAEMPGVYPAGEFDMGGFAVGVVELSRATNPLRVQPGDVVLGLASSGIHSNGYSLVRAVVDRAGLDLNRVDPALHAEHTIGRVLLTPTRIYAPAIVAMLRAYRVKKVVSAMAHITGGGLAQNLERSLHPGVDAVLDRTAWSPPPVFGYLQKHGNIDADEMARVFNMGIGYVVVVRPAFADAAARRLERSGEVVYRLGRITKGKGRVRFKR